MDIFSPQTLPVDGMLLEYVIIKGRRYKESEFTLLSQ